MTAITIDEAGRPEIPQQIEITLAQSVNIEIVNGCIVLHPITLESIAHRQGTALVIETPPLGNLDNFIDELRKERIQ